MDCQPSDNSEQNQAKDKAKQRRQLKGSQTMDMQP